MRTSYYVLISVVHKLFGARVWLINSRRCRSHWQWLWLVAIHFHNDDDAHVRASQADLCVPASLRLASGRDNVMHPRIISRNRMAKQIISFKDKQNLRFRTGVSDNRPLRNGDEIENAACVAVNYMDADVVRWFNRTHNQIVSLFVK